MGERESFLNSGPRESRFSTPLIIKWDIFPLPDRYGGVQNLTVVHWGKWRLSRTFMTSKKHHPSPLMGKVKILILWFDRIFLWSRKTCWYALKRKDGVRCNVMGITAWTWTGKKFLQLDPVPGTNAWHWPCSNFEGLK